MLCALGLTGTLLNKRLKLTHPSCSPCRIRAPSCRNALSDSLNSHSV